MSTERSLYTFKTVQNEEILWSEVYPKLQKYCQFLSQSKWDGDDLAQEAMLRALTYYSQDKITSALLNKIAHNHWIDTLRKRKREELKNDQMWEENIPFSGDIVSSVDLLIEHFTPKQAIIFFLKEVFHYQLKEIAEIVNSTEFAIKSSLNRARKRMENQRDNQSLESVWEEEEREQLGKLFHDSLVNQDPAVLIEAIPSLQDTLEVPSAASWITTPFKASAPLSTLSMAA